MNIFKKLLGRDSTVPTNNASKSVQNDLQVTITEFGLYNVRDRKDRVVPNNAIVYPGEHDNMMLSRTTDRIPLILGLTFGVVALFRSGVKSKKTIRLIYRFPPPGEKGKRDGQVHALQGKSRNR